MTTVLYTQPQFYDGDCSAVYRGKYIELGNTISYGTLNPTIPMVNQRRKRLRVPWKALQGVFEMSIC